MSNTILIKRGEERPKTGDLQPYELGYSKKEKSLYIGLENGAIQPVSSTIIGPTTTLMKSKSSDRKNQILQVYCENLEPGEEYVIYLYTLQKSRGNASRYWRHPSNELIIKEKEGEQIVATGSFTGYANIANTFITTDSENQHLPVPVWMNRSGVLQSEWEFTAEKESQIFSINLTNWIADLLKCDFNEQKWTLMGLSNKKQNTTARMFQFRLKKKNGDRVYGTTNFLVLSDVSRGMGDNDEIDIGYFSIKN